MLCASGFEFEKKLRLASQEQQNAQRALQPGSSESTSKRVEAAAKRYNRRLSDFTSHKSVCTYAWNRAETLCTYRIRDNLVTNHLRKEVYLHSDVATAENKWERNSRIGWES
jgi:hypothetical protein